MFQLVDLWLLFFLILTAIFTGLDIWIDYEFRRDLEKQKYEEEKSTEKVFFNCIFRGVEDDNFLLSLLLLPALPRRFDDGVLDLELT